jgi:hypothetical protein
MALRSLRPRELQWCEGIPGETNPLLGLAEVTRLRGQTGLARGLPVAYFAVTINGRTVSTSGEPVSTVNARFTERLGVVARAVRSRPPAAFAMEFAGAGSLPHPFCGRVAMDVSVGILIICPLTSQPSTLATSLERMHA